MKLAVLLLTALPAFAGTFHREVPPFTGSVLYVPDDGKKTHPGVLLLHGSDGGLEPFNWLKGEFLAANGYVALAFCYFDCERYSSIAPRETLTKVPLEKSFAALKWLRESEYVKGHRVAVYGVSRGGEQALVLASLAGADPSLPHIDAVLTHAPSDQVNGSWN